MKAKAKRKRLQRRIRAYELMIANMRGKAKEGAYKCPGSYKR